MGDEILGDPPAHAKSWFAKVTLTRTLPNMGSALHVTVRQRVVTLPVHDSMHASVRHCNMPKCAFPSLPSADA